MWSVAGTRCLVCSQGEKVHTWCCVSKGCITPEAGDTDATPVWPPSDTFHWKLQQRRNAYRNTRVQNVSNEGNIHTYIHTYVHVYAHTVFPQINAKTLQSHVCLLQSCYTMYVHTYIHTVRYVTKTVYMCTHGLVLVQWSARWPLLHVTAYLRGRREVFVTL